MILSYVSGFDSREQHPPVAGSRDKEECMMDVQQPLRSASVAPSSVFHDFQMSRSCAIITRLVTLIYLPLCVMQPAAQRRKAVCFVML